MRNMFSWITPIKKALTSKMMLILAALSSSAVKMGPSAMVLAVIVTDSVPILPTQPIAVAAGALFGFYRGIVSVLIGQAIATTFALHVGRRFSSKILKMPLFANGKSAEFLNEIAAELNSDSFITVFSKVFVARSSPFVPFSIGNYLIGAITAAPIIPTVLGTITAGAPLNSVQVFLGAGGKSALDSLSGQEDGHLKNVVRMIEILGVLTTVVIVMLIVRAMSKISRSGNENRSNSGYDSIPNYDSSGKYKIPAPETAKESIGPAQIKKSSLVQSYNKLGGTIECV